MNRQPDDRMKEWRGRLSTDEGRTGSDVGLLVMAWREVLRQSDAKAPIVAPAGLGGIGGGAADQAAVSRHSQAMLWAKAYQSVAALTFSSPRTRKRVRPRLRAWALTHSAVAARCL